MRFFNEWVALVTERWPSVAELPLVDHTIPEMSHGLGEEFSGACMRRTLAVPDHDADNPVHRFVLLNALYRLAHMFFPVEEDAESARTLAWDGYREAADLLAPSHVGEVHTLRWEIVAAAAGEMWPRVRALFDRWRALYPAEWATIEELRARVLWLSVCGVSDDGEGVEAVWLPNLPSPLPAWFAELFVLTRAILEGSAKSDAVDPSTLTPEGRERLADALVSLEKAMDGGHQPNVVSAVILARCRFLLGRARQDASLLSAAAETYQTVLQLPENVWADAGMPGNFIPRDRLYECALACRKEAAQFSQAEALIREWLSVSGDRPAIWEHLAEVQIKQLDLEGARASIINAIANNEKYQTDWKATLLVGLATKRDPIAAIEAALADERALNPSVAELAEALSARYWPPFESLSRNSRTMWVNGVRLLHDPQLARLLSDARFQSAGHSFAVAVENELRGRVFDPFLEAHPWIAQKFKHGDDNLAGAALIKYAARRGELTLGQMVFLMADCSESSDPVLTTLRSWLESHARSLLRLMDQLRRLATHRNRVSHGNISRTDVEDLERLAETVLTNLPEIDR